MIFINVKKQSCCYRTARFLTELSQKVTHSLSLFRSYCSKIHQNILLKNFGFLLCNLLSRGLNDTKDPNPSLAVIVVLVVGNIHPFHKSGRFISKFTETYKECST